MVSFLYSVSELKFSQEHTDFPCRISGKGFGGKWSTSHCTLAWGSWVGLHLKIILLECSMSGEGWKTLCNDPVEVNTEDHPSSLYLPLELVKNVKLIIVFKFGAEFSPKV